MRQNVGRTPPEMKGGRVRQGIDLLISGRLEEGTATGKSAGKGRTVSVVSGERAQVLTPSTLMCWHRCDTIILPATLPVTTPRNAGSSTSFECQWGGGIHSTRSRPATTKRVQWHGSQENGPNGTPAAARDRVPKAGQVNLSTVPDILVLSSGQAHVPHATTYSVCIPIVLTGGPAHGTAWAHHCWSAVPARVI